MFYKILDIAYRKLWVKIFGRILFSFVKVIEGRDTDSTKPTYEIDVPSSISSLDHSDKS